MADIKSREEGIDVGGSIWMHMSSFLQTGIYLKQSLIKIIISNTLITFMTRNRSNNI